jgi:esterase/lipase superfamily enzyme
MTLESLGDIPICRTILSFIVSLLVVLPLTSCGTRPSSAVLQTVAVAAPGTRTATVYVTTTRSPDKDGLGYGDGKAHETHYLEYTISIPPGHKSGEIEYPALKPDPQKSFVVVGRRILDKPAFLATVAARKDKEVGVFVHGFNYSFQESLLRVAQMSADSQVDGVPILFAWPSSAAITGYVADKEAATYSRDALASLLTDLAQMRFTKRIVFGHSMGGWLTIESLRQLRLSGQGQVLARLTVVLAAPDIDVDVFRKDVETIGRLPTPMTVLVSSDDRALKVSSILSRDRRVGALDVKDPEVEAAARRFNIAIVDISGLQASDSLNHDRYVALASAYGQLGANGQPNGLQRAGAFVFNTVGATISSPFTLASTAISGN